MLLPVLPWLVLLPTTVDAVSVLKAHSFEVVASQGNFVEPGSDLRFRWKLECVCSECSCCRGAAQHSYRIVLTSAREERVIWDSGVANASAPSAKVGGLLLQADASFTASITVWSRAGCRMEVRRSTYQPSATSTTFHTALASGHAPGQGSDADSDWQGEWISGGTQLRGVMSINTSARIVKAVAYASAVGCFAVSLNGQALTGVNCDPNLSGKGCDSYLDPGFSTVPSWRLLYRAFDVAKILKNGTNVVGVRLGQCKYGYIQSYCTPADAWQPSCRAFLLQLNVHFSDGTRQNFTSSAGDGKWSATVEGNPIFYTHLFHGEMYDARREDTGWDNAAGPSISSLWFAAVKYLKADDLGRLSLFTTPPVRVTERREPIRIYAVLDEWMFDFGQNWAGFATLNVSGLRNGTHLTLRYAEITHANGSVYNTYCGKNHCAGPPSGTWALAWDGPNGEQWAGNRANQTDLYIARGGDEVYTPTFTYHGFRYVSIKGLPASYTPSKDTLTSLFVHSDTPVVGKVHFNNESMQILNKIQTAIVYTQLSNFHTIPTDCCQREKRGWLGDAQWTSEEASLNLDASAFYENFVRTFSDTQEVGCSHVASLGTSARPPTYECCSRKHPTFGCNWDGVTDNFTDSSGSLPDVVPYSRKTYGGWPGDPSWMAASTEIPYQSWKSSGDLHVLREAYPQARALVEFMLRHVDKAKGITQFGFYGDWLAPQNTDRSAVSSFSFMLMVDRLLKMADALGNRADVARYAPLQAGFKSSWHALYFNNTTSSYAGDTQTGNAMALYLDIPPTPEIKNKTLSRLVDTYVASGDKPTFGTVGARIFLPVLATMGRMDLALGFATKRTRPSFGYMVEQGPGTIWEKWSGSKYDADGGSKNHPMFCGGMGVFLYQLAGLASEGNTGVKPAWGLSAKRNAGVALSLDAVAVARIGRAEAAVQTPGGVLDWSWRFLSDHLHLTVRVPHGLTKSMRIELPKKIQQRSAIRLTEQGDSRHVDAMTLWQVADIGGAVASLSTLRENGIDDVWERGDMLVIEIRAGEYRLRLDFESNDKEDESIVL